MKKLILLLLLTIMVACQSKVEEKEETKDNVVFLEDCPDSLSVPHYFCKMCNSEEVFIRMFVNPNDDNMINVYDTDSVFCTRCFNFTDYKIYYNNISGKEAVRNYLQNKVDKEEHSRNNKTQHK